MSLLEDEMVWFSPAGKILMFLIPMLQEPGKQVIKDFCKERANGSEAGQEYQGLLEVIDFLENKPPVSYSSGTLVLMGMHTEDWLWPMGKILARYLHVISPTGRQTLKDCCMRNISDPMLGSDLRSLLETINTFKRAVAIGVRTKTR